MAEAYVQFDEALCTGCTKCVRACPTKAVRIRNERATLFPELCIGCGECIRVCPEGAVSSTLSYQRLGPTDKVSVAIVSPVLYAQFPGVVPCDVLIALNRIGFDHAIDLSYYLEMFQFAAEEFILRNRESNEVPWPLISPICPVISRLIALRYPNLLPHILPLKRPAAMAGEEVRRKISERDGVAESEIVIYHLTPCPSKLISDRAHFLDDLSEMDLALGINDIYPQLLEAVEAVRDMDLSLFPYQNLSFVPNARGPMWGMSGGEIAGMNTDRVLAVSGLKECINYIEKIEMGLFQDMEYIEFRACREGCLGGPLTAADKYEARSTVQKLIKMFGLGRRLQHQKLRRLYDRGWFFSKTKPTEMKEKYVIDEPPLTIEQMGQIEQILQQTAGNDCGACGAPDCRTFAEDVVRGYANMEDCYRIALDRRGIGPNSA
jgi:iron only hydrogenase large subunit-like protein